MRYISYVACSSRFTLHSNAAVQSVFPVTLHLEKVITISVVIFTVEGKLPAPRTGRKMSVQNLLQRIQDLETNMNAMKEKMVRFS